MENKAFTGPILGVCRCRLVVGESPRLGVLNECYQFLAPAPLYCSLNEITTLQFPELLSSWGLRLELVGNINPGLYAENPMPTLFKIMLVGQVKSSTRLAGPFDPPFLC